MATANPVKGEDGESINLPTSTPGFIISGQPGANSGTDSTPLSGGEAFGFGGGGGSVQGGGGSTVRGFGGKGGSVTLNGGDIKVEGGAGGTAFAPTARGGTGGGATVTVSGNMDAGTVTVQSGSSGTGGTDSAGGDVTLTVTGTLNAETITLTKKDGDLSFKVGTLDVSSDTLLELDGTDKDNVTIRTIALGSGTTLEVVSSSANGGDFDFEKLNVLGKEATYTGNLDVSGKTLTFDLSSVGNGESMLTVETTSSLDLRTATIDFTGTPTLKVGDKIYLLKSVGNLIAPSSEDHYYTANGYVYTFNVEGNSDELYLVVVDVIKQTVTVVRVRDDDSNNNTYDAGGMTGAVHPVISSISADPIPGGAELSVTAFSYGWNGETYDHSYQWQVQLDDGSWVDIPGATTNPFEYTGLEPGEYTVRCIVRNSTGGEAISTFITFTVP